MAKTVDIISRIEMKYNKLSKGQKKIAAYITEHYDSAVFMTAAKLGAEINVSESTVVRFASVLGYNGYPELQKALEEWCRENGAACRRSV